MSLENWNWKKRKKKHPQSKNVQTKSGIISWDRRNSYWITLMRMLITKITTLKDIFEWQKGSSSKLLLIWRPHALILLRNQCFKLVLSHSWKRDKILTLGFPGLHPEDWSVQHPESDLCAPTTCVLVCSQFNQWIMLACWSDSLKNHEIICWHHHWCVQQRVSLIS